MRLVGTIVENLERKKNMIKREKERQIWYVDRGRAREREKKSQKVKRGTRYNRSSKAIEMEKFTSELGNLSY